jgi:hypothetical protein
MKGILCILACCWFAIAQAKDRGDYAVSNIPAGLMKNANVIKRLDEIQFEITEGNKAIMKRRVAYTIMNEEGDRWSFFSEGYDKLKSIVNFDGTLYDAAGKKLKNLKKSDIKDVSGTEESLADDDRVKWHSFFYKNYPFTVEYEVEVEYKGTMFLPKWMPQERYDMAVQQSDLIVICPASNPLHYKMYNYDEQPSVTDDKSNKVYRWAVKDKPTLENEFAAPAWHFITTSVFMATEKFMLEDYRGSNASWKDFGQFVYDLKKDRDVLPDNVKQTVHQLTDGITDQHEKIKKLYEYMQQNTRYISIQLGIGGWQPYDAKYVATKKYGDCKALSNFMFALLKEAGIKAVYTVIGADMDNDYLIPELPCSQFNHVILFVPNGKDTTWLECTSPTNATGYLGGFTSNRYAVAVDENGGTLVRTPKYSYKDNIQIRHLSAVVDENGNLEATVKTKYTAEQQDRLHSIINGLSKDKLMEFLKEDIDLATYDVKSFEYNEEKTALPVIHETLDLTSDNYATVSGKRLFIAPNVMSRTHRKLKTEEERKYDVVLDFEFKDVDTSEIKLPLGYTPESIPADVSIESKFGKYKCAVKLDGNKILYYRSYEHYSGHFAPKDYDELLKFYESIYKADRNKVVLIKDQLP